MTLYETLQKATFVGRVHKGAGAKERPAQPHREMTMPLRHIGRARHRPNRYDHLDRRVQKITPAATHTYFHDGWLLIKEIVANTNGATDVIEYHWGKDLSGTIGGAGGVGGLLYLTISNSNSNSQLQLYVPWYDAYGNIMGYWDAQGNVVAEYTYDAFGKMIASSGPMAEVFSFRYSTKYFDSETGLYYYGYRFYSPDLMRWITRDPIGEEGGVNLYAMCGNDALNQFDELGEFTIHYVTYKETSIFEHLNTGQKLKDIEPKNEFNLYVEYKTMAPHGAFYNNPFFYDDCHLEVRLSIWLHPDLQKDAKMSDEFVVLPHKNSVYDGYSYKRGGGRPLKGAVLAHERGHAKAFFAHKKSIFESKIASLRSKPKLTEAEKKTVLKAYSDAEKENVLF